MGDFVFDKENMTWKPTRKITEIPRLHKRIEALEAENARLLAACETMLAWMEARNCGVIRQWPSGEVPCEEYEQLRAAIVEAKGAHNE